MTSYCIDYDDVKSAMEAIRPYVHRTPLLTCSSIDRMVGREVFMKTENFQKTGSFKFRGATNTIIKLKEGESKPNCVVTESSGNHGQALAKAAQTLGIPCYVVMPEWSVKSKVTAVKGYGAEVFLVKPTAEARKEKSDELIKKFGGVFVDPSQDPRIMAGQGTTALEILEDNPDIDIIIAPVGGGGLISGVAVAAKAMKPSIKVIAAEPENANDCYLSKREGRHIYMSKDPDTIADGVRVGVGTNAWPIIRDLVDDVITVTEDEIKNGMFTVWQRSKLVIEPTTGVGIAAVLSDKFKKIKGQKVAVILCGGNVDLNSIPKLLE